MWPDPSSAESNGGVGRVESRWPPALAVLAFIVLNGALRLWLPNEDLIAVPWLLPIVSLVLLFVLMVSIVVIGLVIARAVNVLT